MELVCTPTMDDNDAVANDTTWTKKRPLDDKEEEEGDDDNDDTKKKTTMNALVEGSQITPVGEMPQKRFFRQRAHCNPLSHNDTFEYPTTPLDMDWSVHYPNPNNNENDNDKQSLPPTVLDIGCGFGGLTIALATLLPNERILGMEIRAKVCEYVRLRIVALRQQNQKPQPEPQQEQQVAEEKDRDKNEATTTAPSSLLYYNCSVMRTNSMKFLPHYFAKASMTNLFFCFPDPHFKRKNHGRRIVTERLLSEYAYLLRPGIGRLYCITDVEDLHQWHVRHCNAHALFQRLDNVDDDPCVQAMNTTTEESQKVDRAGATKYYAVYQRIPDPTTTMTTIQHDDFFSPPPCNKPEQEGEDNDKKTKS